MVDDSEILRACRQGRGRNEIATALNVSRRRVSAVASAAGHTFNRTRHTAAARATRQRDSHERRAALSAQVLERAERALADLDALGPPTDALDVERRTRALAAIAQSMTAIARANPLQPDQTDAMQPARDAFAAFMASAAQFAAAADNPPHPAEQPNTKEPE